MKWRESVVKDGVIGFAIGDALGVPVEYTERALLDLDPVTHMRGYGTYRQPAGTWSDETSLMLATMDSITQMGQIHLDDMMIRYLSWYDEKAYVAYHEVFDLNTIISTALGNYRSGVAAFFCGGRSDFHNGNGGLTRMLPLAYFLESPHFKQNAEESSPLYRPDYLAIEAIHQVSCLTNGHYVALVSASIYTYLARWLIRWRLQGGQPGSLRAEDLIDPIAQILDGLEQIYLNMEYSFMVSPLGERTQPSQEERDGFAAAFKLFDRIRQPELFRLLPIDAIQSDGYCLHSMELVIHCLLNHSSFEDTVLSAVNLGADTDTHGAMVGGLAGILYGQAYIPQEWQHDLAKKQELEQHADMASITFYRPELRSAFMLIPWLEATSPFGLPMTLNREVFYPLAGQSDIYPDWAGVELSLHQLINSCSLQLSPRDVEAVEERIWALRSSRQCSEGSTLPDLEFYEGGMRSEGAKARRLRALADLIYLLEGGKLQRYLLHEASFEDRNRSVYLNLLQANLLRIRRLYGQGQWFGQAVAPTIEMLQPIIRRA